MNDTRNDTRVTQAKQSKSTQSKQSKQSIAHEIPRNEGIPFDEAWLDLNINRSAVERRAATLPTRRSVKKEYQAAWLLKAVTCIDLTTLAGCLLYTSPSPRD